MCLRTYPLPKVHENIFKEQVERLVLLGFLDRANYSKWGAPSFTKPKPKSNQVDFLSNFRNLNKQLKRKPYPMPKTNEIVLKLEGFQYSIPLGLNMG